MARVAKIERSTNETQISVSLDLDGTGERSINTGIGFFDHMLDQLAKHSLINMTITARGDLHLDQHHTVDDPGIAIGQALKDAIGDKRGITRYGTAYLPMDEALSRVSLDFSNRAFLVWNVSFSSEKIGDFDTELVREFFQALSAQAGLTLHVENLYGANSHHIAESCFKALAKALRQAVEVDTRAKDALPSTKGAL